MHIQVFDTKQELGRAAAERAAAAIAEAIGRAGEARVIAATGASQFEFLDALTDDAGRRLGTGRDVPPRRVRGPSRHAPRELPPLPPRADRPARTPPRLPLPGRGRAGPRRGVPARGRAARPGADRRGVRGHRRERPPGVQRPSGRLRDRGAVPRRRAGRGVPAPAARRGLVPRPRRRAAAGDLDVDPPDPEGARDPLRRPRRAQGAGRSATASRARSARSTRRRSCRRTRRRRSTSTATRPRC